MTGVPANAHEFLMQQLTGPYYTVTAHASHHYWELHIHGIGVTQAAPRESHRNMILDYLNSLEYDTENAHILIHYPAQLAP